jgi:hypothetical protein
MIAPPPARTFLQFYEDAQKDPCRGNYQRIMQRFDPIDQGAANPEVLYDQALGTPATVHQAYFCCAATRRGPRIFCIHAPSRFTSAMDGHVTLWNNSSYAFLGDVTQDVVTSVVFPPTVFNTTPEIIVYTAEHLVANLPALNGLDGFPAIVGNEVKNTSPVTTRYIMYLPSRYVLPFLDSSGYTIKEVWQTLFPLIEQNQDIQNCRALLDWLRVASHDTALINAQGQQARGPPANTIHLISPAADKDLILHRQQVLKLALPGLGQITPGLESALFQMANAMMTQTTDQHAAREAKVAKAMQPTSPSTKFRNTLPILMDYLQVQNEEELPILWHQWANASKRQEFGVLRELLEAYARGPASF